LKSLRKKYRDKNIENMWKIIAWQKCGNILEKNKVVKIWKKCGNE
jgi:hypothetical protein